MHILVCLCPQIALHGGYLLRSAQIQLLSPLVLGSIGTCFQLETSSRLQIVLPTGKVKYSLEFRLKDELLVSLSAFLFLLPLASTASLPKAHACDMSPATGWMLGLGFLQ